MVEIKITNEAIEFLMETTGQSREDVLDWFQIALSMCDMSAQQANGADAEQAARLAEEKPLN